MKIAYFWLFLSLLALEIYDFLEFLLLLKWNAHAIRWLPCHYWSKCAVVGVSVTWRQINSVPRAINELFMVRIVALGGDCDVCYCLRLAQRLGFLTIASKSIYDHVTSTKKLGCDDIFCCFSVSNRCSLYMWVCKECINAAKLCFSLWRKPQKVKQKSSKLQGRGRPRFWSLETFCAM